MQRQRRLIDAQGDWVKLLLVDDDEDTREVLRLYLESRGCEVDTAACLEEARRALASENYSGLLTDVNLPDGDGRSLLSKGRPAKLELAVVLSGALASEAGRESFAAGFDDHLTKPLNRRRLDALIANLGDRGAT